MMDAGYALVEKVSEYAGPQSRDVVRRALDMATETHAGYYRLDGNPYIYHSIAVAEILASWRAPAEIVAAGLLHDVLNRDYACRPSLGIIEDVFGPDVADIVWGVAQLGRFGPTFPSYKPNKLFENVEHVAESLPWVTLVLKQIPTAVVIKIADRMDNFNSLSVLSLEQQKAFAAASLNIFVPFSERLGMWIAKQKLEDIAFRVLQPDQYRIIGERYPAQKREAEAGVIVESIRQHLTGKGLKAQVLCAPVSLYAVYRREIKRGKPFPLQLAQPILILTDSSLACYQALGVVHELWAPQAGGVRDYIAAPKPNGYRALHTRVRYEPGITPDVLIRTHEMNLVAERGLIAGWLGVAADLLPTLPEWRRPPPGKIAVYTPNFDQKLLPKGATPIDFAYAIHRGFGHQCTGAIVNGSAVPLHETLSTGDVVKILTSEAIVGPSPDWLEKVKTYRARHEIRRWLASQSDEEIAQKGWDLLAARLHEHGINLSSAKTSDLLQAVAKRMGYPSGRDLLIEVGRGKCGLNRVVFQIQGLPYQDGSKFLQAIVIDLSHAHLSRRFARCCRPQPPDPIVGYVTKQNKAVIHRADCGNVRRLIPLIAAEWDIPIRQHIMEIQVIASDRPGLLLDVTKPVTELGINMTSVYAKQLGGGSAQIQIDLEDVTTWQLNRMLKNIGQVPDVRHVEFQTPFANPYTLKPVSGEGFYGRRVEMRELVNNLRGVKPSEAVLLWGPRRVGKTSLLLEFQRIVLNSKSYLSIFIDMQALSGGTTTVFLHTIAMHITRDLRNPHISVPSLKEMSHEPLNYFRSFMEDVRRYESRHLILILDEFQILIGLREERDKLADIFTYFRSLVQHSGGMSFIFCGGGTFDVLYKQVGASSLLEVIRTQKLDCLVLEDARQLIIEPLKLVEYDNNVIKRLLDLTAGHPYYLQLLCGELVFHANREERRNIEHKHLDDVLLDWLPDQGEQFFSHLWGLGSGIEREALKQNKLALVAIATNTDESRWVSIDRIFSCGLIKVIDEASLWNVLQNLVKMETLETKESTQYRFKVELCEQWMRNNFTVQQVIKEIGD